MPVKGFIPPGIRGLFEIKNILCDLMLSLLLIIAATLYS